MTDLRSDHRPPYEVVELVRESGRVALDHRRRCMRDIAAMEQCRSQLVSPGGLAPWFPIIGRLRSFDGRSSLPV